MHLQPYQIPNRQDKTHTIYSVEEYDVKMCRQTRQLSAVYLEFCEDAADFIETDEQMDHNETVEWLKKEFGVTFLAVFVGPPQQQMLATVELEINNA